MEEFKNLASSNPQPVKLSASSPIRENLTKNDYSRFKEHVRLNDNEITMVSRAHLLVEYYLNQLISTELKRGDIIVGNRFTFDQKLTIVKAISCLPTQILDSVKQLNSVRNSCAHEINYTISENDIDKIGMPFGKDYLETKLENISDTKKLLYETLFTLLARLSGVAANIRQEKYQQIKNN